MSSSLPDGLLDEVERLAPTHLVLVGGGDGSGLVAILRRLPSATGALVDRPDAVARAGPVLEAAGVAERVDVVALGPDDPIPPGGDVYVVVDPALVGRCQAAMAPTARLIEIDDKRNDDRRRS